MALLSSTQQAEFSGIFAQHFDLFSSQSNNYITVVKTPVKLINNPTENVLPGYGAENMDVTSITYNHPVTGVFPAIIIYPKTQQSTQFAQLKFNIDDNQVVIKVTDDCRSFIVNNKTERIVIDSQNYNNELTYTVQSFMGLKYYYFKLTSTR